MKKLVCTFLLCAASVSYAGVDEGLAAYDKGDYKTALKELKPLAEQGNPKAQFKLANIYRSEGVQQDYKQAIVWFTKAAEQGFAEAQNNLGNMYANGQGVPQNHKLAYILFNLAASKGDDNAVKARDVALEKLTPTAKIDAQSISTQLYNSKNLAADLRKLLNSPN